MPDSLVLSLDAPARPALLESGEQGDRPHARALSDPVRHRGRPDGGVVFSLGVVLFELLTSERPFKGASAADMASSILPDRPPTVTEGRGELPPHLARIPRRCLASPAFVTAWLAYALGATGDRAGAMAELEDLKK